MEKEIIRNILSSQRSDLFRNKDASFLKRDVSLDLRMHEKEITIVSGVRRCGKSSILEEYIKLNLDLKSYLYLNFEDPQLIDFKAEDFIKLYEIWVETNDSESTRVAFFDEIQNVEGWERWMNFFSKQKGFKVFITGSNSNLLSSELGSHLTGRHRSITLYPLSFKEILTDIKGKDYIDAISKRGITIEDQIEMQTLTKRYLEIGGFPRAWITKDTSILYDYYGNILNRDIVKRKKIRNAMALDKLGLALMSDIGRKLNKTKLALSIGLKNGDTAERYLSYFEECYLGFQIRKYDSSVRNQLRNQTKFYAIDTALAKRVGIPSDSKSTYSLENIVLIELLRRAAKVYYWQSDHCEIDFVVETKERERHLIQVCWNIEDQKTQDRETSAFKEFSSRYKNLKVHKKLVITLEGQKKTIGDNINITPFYLWAVEEC